MDGPTSRSVPCNWPPPGHVTLSHTYIFPDTAQQNSKTRRSWVEGRPGVPDRQLWVPVGPGYVCGSPHFWRQLGVPDTSVTFLDPGYHQKAFCGSRSLSRRTWVPGCRRVERGSPHRGVRQGLDTFDRPRFLLLIRWSACGVPRLRSRVHFPSSSTVTRI